MNWQFLIGTTIILVLRFKTRFSFTGNHSTETRLTASAIKNLLQPDTSKSLRYRSMQTCHKCNRFCSKSFSNISLFVFGYENPSFNDTEILGGKSKNTPLKQLGCLFKLLIEDVLALSALQGLNNWSWIWVMHTFQTNFYFQSFHIKHMWYYWMQGFISNSITKTIIFSIY